MFGSYNWQACRHPTIMLDFVLGDPNGYLGPYYRPPSKRKIDLFRAALWRHREEGPHVRGCVAVDCLTGRD